MANEWAGVVNTTTRKYLKGFSDLTIRERILWARLKKRGNISYDHSGIEIQEQVKFSRPETESYTGGVIDFEPSDKYRRMRLDWRSLIVADMLTEKERLMNRAAPALINRYGNTMKDMRESLEDQFSTDVYNDGGSNTERFDGLETFLAAGGTCVLTDKIAAPSDTYATRSTGLASEAGSWSSNMATPPNAVIATDWPEGLGTPEYDYFSPRLLNYASTAWTNNENSWINNCERVIRQGVLWATLTTGKSGKPDLCLLPGQMYYDYMNAQEPKQRIIIPYGPGDELGFEGVKQEGVFITTEFGMTATVNSYPVGYLLNTNKMDFRCMYNQLFMPRGPEFDINTLSYKFLMGTWGNFRFLPKFFTKLAKFHA